MGRLSLGVSQQSEWTRYIGPGTHVAGVCESENKPLKPYLHRVHPYVTALLLVLLALTLAGTLTATGMLT